MIPRNTRRPSGSAAAGANNAPFRRDTDGHDGQPGGHPDTIRRIFANRQVLQVNELDDVSGSEQSQGRKAILSQRQSNCQDLWMKIV